MTTRVLFVCLGNICRSPTAEAVFRARIEADADLRHRIEIDSAGTGDWHVGNPPDPRSRKVGKARGYDLEPLRARQVEIDDFYQFDFILAMDKQNLSDLQRLKPAGYSGHIGLFLAFGENPKTEVPDPYYSSGDTGFHEVIDLIESASAGLIQHLKSELN